MNLNSKPLLLALMFALLFAGVFAFAAAPLAAGIKKNGAEIFAQQKKIGDYDRRIANARGFNEFARREKDSLEKLGGYFIDSQMPLEFIDSLETAARDAGVTTGFSSSPQLREAKSGGWPAVSFEMEISGPTAGILRFVGKLETSPYLITLRNVEIGSGQRPEQPAAAGPDSVEGAVRARVLIDVYAKQR